MNTYLSYQTLVYPWVIDQNGHLNVQHYVGFFDCASWNFLAAAGFGPEHFRQSHTGFVAKEQNISYHKEVLAGQIIQIHSSCSHIGTSSLGLKHEMTISCTSEPAASMNLAIVQIDTETRFKAPLPEQTSIWFANIGKL